MQFKKVRPQEYLCQCTSIAALLKLSLKHLTRLPFRCYSEIRERRIALILIWQEEQL